nr:RNA-directed DNA polymerase, eukaryota [Tanacetum cinerariifolium]
MLILNIKGSFSLRLVSNLCTVWIDRHKLQANIARFKRNTVNGSYAGGKANVGFRDNNMKDKNNVVEKVIVKSIDHNAGLGNSCVRVVKGEEKKGIGNEKTQPAMVLDDECLISRDLSNFLMGRANVSIGSWFSDIKAASLDFQLIKRIAWVEEEMCYHSKRLWIHTKMVRNISEEFKIIHQGKIYWVRANETPGWVPDCQDEIEDEEQDDNYMKFEGVNEQNSNISDDDNDVERISETVFPVDDQKDINKEEGEIDQKQENINKEEENYDEKNILAGGESVNMADPADRVGSYKNCKFPKNSDESGDNSISSGHFKNFELPRTGGSILGVLEEVIKVGTVMGYKLEGCMSNIAEIIEAKGVEEGKWCHTGQDLLIGVVYAPHDIKEKYMLWDYLHCEIARWKGQVVIMGDFNEVRVKSDRYGSVFNARGAQRFNSFILDSGLVEINLGGYHYTWCHKSAKKMSKLDRFLVSENLINNSPNITAISLDQYLSDHRPILLRERYKSHAVKDDNAIRYIMGKFKFVKSKIREWNAYYKNEAKKDKDQCIRDLVNIDDIIASGNRGEEEVLRRAEIVNKIQKIDGLLAKELAQKTKIKWAIEGDENSKFFHGMLNKKHSSTGVRGVMVDGKWVDDPQQVKKEFYDHFSARFSMPNNKDASILMDFPKKILESQLRGLECEVSNDKIKKAVWDCGTKKAPSPDGFTFGFFRHFWYLIHNEVYDDVSPTEEFQFGKGLKQGDPLSPFLFILIIESLHLSFQRIVDEGMFKGIKLGEGLVNLSHMFYVDDAVFVGQWCENNITTLVHVLDCFYKVSSLRINMSKSKIMRVHVDVEKVNRAATKLGCIVFKIPFTYLGSIVGGNMSRKHL